MPCQSGQLHCILLLDLGPTFVSALERKIGATPSLALVDRLEERDGITASYWRGLLRTFEEEKPRAQLCPCTTFMCSSIKYCRRYLLYYI